MTDCTGHEDVAVSQWNGFKIVGDNLDKNITPRFMRHAKQTQSLHFFNAYAVKLSSFSSYKPYINIDVDLMDILAMHSKLLHNIDSSKLSGLHPVTEDWHAKVILLEVFYNNYALVLIIFLILHGIDYTILYH